MKCLKFTALAICVPVVGHTQDLLALPGFDGLNMWNTQTPEPSLTLGNIAGGTAGTCYTYAPSEGTLTTANDPQSCLSYMIIPPENRVTQEPPYEISGAITFMSKPLGETYNGFKITGVSGVEYCGERDGCDEIFVRGVTSPELLATLVTAAQSGQTVNVSGPAVWNLESIDIVIDSIQ